LDNQHGGEGSRCRAVTNTSCVSGARNAKGPALPSGKSTNAFRFPTADRLRSSKAFRTASALTHRTRFTAQRVPPGSFSGTVRLKAGAPVPPGNISGERWPAAEVKESSTTLLRRGGAISVARAPASCWAREPDSFRGAAAAWCGQRRSWRLVRPWIGTLGTGQCNPRIKGWNLEISRRWTRSLAPRQGLDAILAQENPLGGNSNPQFWY
jgi:hypothetical protein